jgi:hypothetical protein
LFTALFCLGTGLTTASGRLHFGVGQAFSSRYQTVSLLFWCCLGLVLLAMIWGFRQTQNVVFLLSQVIVLSAMLVGLKLAQVPLTKARLHGFQLNVAAIVLVTNVPDLEQLQLAYPDPGYLFPFATYMREERLSVFFGRLSSLMGMPLDSMFNLTSSNECTGKLESATEVASAWPRSLRITGWAWDSKHRRPPSGVVIATHGVIMGLGAVGDWHPMNQAANPWMASSFIGFTGYVQNVEQSSPMDIYAILRDGRATACLIATPK